MPGFIPAYSFSYNTIELAEISQLCHEAAFFFLSSAVVCLVSVSGCVLCLFQTEVGSFSSFYGIAPM